MPNFYRDNKDILFQIKNMDLANIIAMREENYTQKNTFPEAPQDLNDALDNYDRVLEIIGEIAGDIIAPRAPQVDLDGATYNDGEVTYAKGTQVAIDRLTKADLMGFTLPRRFGGLNLPKILYSVAIEIISRADAALMNIFGLQEIAETINHFGSEDQRQRFLPRFCRGEVFGAMALTEPDAGSDLQAVTLSACEGGDGYWYLNGVKRFITNGCANVSLVLARSEEGISGGRGLSFFLYERDKNMRIRRIENKLGIHGSPTCELQFNNAKAELIGERRFGLVKYTMSLMNGARLGVAAQALGIAEAAYREAENYAASRVQFGKPIRSFPAIQEMITDMRVAIEAGRTLLYETSRIVDIKESLEDIIEHHPERKTELQDNYKRYNKFASLFTPIAKAYNSEMANKVSYDALQVHGGNGFMKDFNIERHYRDARITNIYEGTTQLQVVAAIGGIVSGVLFARIDEYEANNDFSSIAELHYKAHELRKLLEMALNHIKNKNDKLFQEYHERRLVEMGTDVIISYLICIDALKAEHKQIIAQLFISKALSRNKGVVDYILTNDGFVGTGLS